MTQLNKTLAATFSIVLSKASIASAQSLTGPQKNAVRSANNYLSMTGFSRLGLINQLSSSHGDGYSATDAAVAVDSLSVDWFSQAARSAKQYLDVMGFSSRGLIKQLSSNAGDKYTVDQATYGARKAGACERIGMWASPVFRIFHVAVDFFSNPSKYRR